MPTNSDLLARREKAVPRGVSTAYPIFAKHAENAWLWDEEGRAYIDFAGGIGTLNTGHRHPKIVKAISEQLGLLTHSAFQVVAYEPYIALTERLNALAPFRGLQRRSCFRRAQKRSRMRSRSQGRIPGVRASLHSPAHFTAAPSSPVL
jgi:4-aminobutyrate aminotransferase-like enzyme